jgi:hypothetical protein
MKKIICIAVLIISNFTFAQSGLKEDIEVVQSLYGKSKQELVFAYMNLQEPQATKFGIVYEAYEAERKLLGQKRIQLINDYILNYETLTNAKADEIAKASLANNSAYEKLYSKYYGKVQKIIGAINAAKFIQLETALQTAIKSETQNAIPFIGEIDRSKIN